jgi:thioredoxin-like negative regulator of GroEL
MGVVTLGAFGGQALTAPGKNPSQGQQMLNIPPPFAETVAASLGQSKPVLIFVFFQGCPPCERATPIVRKLANDFAGTVTYLPIDYDEYTDQVLTMGVTGTPTIYIVTRHNADGAYSASFSVVGFAEEEILKAALQKAVATQ